MALNLITAQMSETIEYVVTKRQSNFDYFKRVHQGKAHWLNVVKLSKAHIAKYFPADKLTKRSYRWLTLGMSVGRILELNSGASVCRALCQLLDEYEYYFNHLPTKEKDKARPYVFSHYVRPSHYRPVNDNEPVKTHIHKVGKQVSYDFLIVPDPALRAFVDYCEVVHSLCDVLSLAYSKLLDPSCQKPIIHEACIKMDKRIKDLVIGKLAKDLTSIATPVLKMQVRSLLSTMFIDDGRGSAGRGRGGKSGGVKGGQGQFIRLTDDDILDEQEENDDEHKD